MNFDFSKFKEAGLEDGSIVAERVFRNNEICCEYNFPNMYTWGGIYKTSWNLFNNHLYIYLPVDDELLLPPERDVTTEELLHVSDIMIQNGSEGAISQVAKDYLEAHPELLNHFTAEPYPEDFGEYIYSVEKLYNLSGSKLAKKKNLFSQFKKLYPNYECKMLDDAVAADCRRLSLEWISDKEKDGKLEFESVALDRTFAHYRELGLEGIAIYIEGKIAAYAIFSRQTADCYNVCFEKASHEYKGSSQAINWETAAYLKDKCKIVNREQDLGVEGLRHAKRSYAPEYLLTNYILKRKK